MSARVVLSRLFFISLLSSFVDDKLFVKFGRPFRRMLPLKAKEPVSQVEVFACGSIKSELDLRLHVSSFRLKTFCLDHAFFFTHHVFKEPEMKMHLFDLVKSI